MRTFICNFPINSGEYSGPAGQTCCNRTCVGSITVHCNEIKRVSPERIQADNVIIKWDEGFDEIWEWDEETQDFKDVDI